jgi:hypothetical protein
MVVYEYSIQNDFPNQAVEVGTFRDELVYDLNFDSQIGVASNGDVCSVQVATALTDPQKASLDAGVAAHLGVAKPFEKKHYEQEFDRTRLIRETWWARSSGDVLSLKVEETLYTYSGSRLITEQFKQYNRDGSAAVTRNWIFRQEKVGTSLRVRKVEQ